MRDVLQSFVIAARSLLRAPRFTLLAVLPLALAVGATTALFSVIAGVLLAPLPYPQPEQLVRVLRATRAEVEPWQSGPNLMEMKERQTTFEGLAGFTGNEAVLTGRNEPRPIRVTQVTAEFFATLGAHPGRGRFFTESENEPGQNGVVVLSDRLFSATFGGDDRVIGTTVSLDGNPVRIVGIAEPGFDYPAGTDAWSPLPYGPRIRNDDYRGGNFIEVTGRLKPGVSTERAQQDLGAIFADIESRFPSGAAPRVVSLRDYTVGSVDRPLRLLFGAMVFVLLVASANQANLLLGRGETRRVELGVRRVLGAGGGRLFGLLMSEGLIIAVGVALLGAALAVTALGGMRRLSILGVPRIDRLSIDPAVLLTGVAISSMIGLSFAALPAFLYSGVVGAGRLGSVGRGSRGDGTTLRRVLVTVEVALSLVLLTSAGLMLRSFARLTAVSTGMEADNVVAADLALRQDRYQATGATAVLVANVEAALRAAPGVESVAFTSGLPLEGNGNRMTFEIAGQSPPDPAARPYMNIRAVSPGYFQALGIPVLSGTGFDESADREAPQVAILSASAERRFFEGRSAIGQSIRLSRRNVDARVIAIVGDVHATGLMTDPEPHIYLPLAQFPLPTLTVVVRGRSGTDGIVSALEAVVHTADPELAIGNVRTLEDVVSRALARPRLIGRLLLLAASLALTLTVTGLFGVVAWHVSARRRELGIRAALGGGPIRIVREVMLPVLPMIAAGCVIGVAGSIVSGRIMSTLLFETGPLETTTLTVASMLLLLTATAAALAPAIGAAATAPASLLRAE